MGLQDHEHDLYKKIILGVSEKRQNKDTAEFSIPDLFTADEWSTFPDISRKKIGRLFKLKVADNRIANLVFCSKNAKSWAVYKIVF